MSAYSGPESLVLRSMTVMERGTVMTYLASLEDLTLKVTGASSAVDSSAMVGLLVAMKDDCRADRVCKDSRTRLNVQSAFVVVYLDKPSGS